MNLKESTTLEKKISELFSGKMGKRQWLVLLLVGVLLAVITLPVKQSDTLVQENTASLLKSDTQKSPENLGTKEQMEKQLEEFLEQVEGVGQVKVLLTLSSENNQIFSEEDPGEVTGVLIAAQGAKDFTVERKIQQAVMALFQIEAHKIKVMKMK